MDVSTQTDFENDHKIKKTPEYHIRAMKKYQETHKEELREKARIRYNQKYQNDPEFREKELKKAQIKREKKKQQLTSTSSTTTVV
jgi:hypothetical protein